MHVGILGPLEVTTAQGGHAVGGPRLRALLIRLALAPGAVVRAETLAGALWGEAAPADPANALQSLVSRLRRALPEPGVLVSEPGGYRLAVPPDAVDAVRFERLAGEGRRALAAGDPARAAGLLREALALWRGPALADAGEAGEAGDVAAEAARLAELRLTALEDRYEAELAAGRPAAEVTAGLEALVAAEPLRERALGLLMRARYAAGRTAEALSAYEEYRTRLADELGADPSPALREIHLAVLRAEPAREAAPASGNLPAPLTSFVGRDHELAVITEQLAHARLVTLVGPGGAGKTRLATTAAAGLAADHPGGAWLVELAAVTDPDDVPAAVVAALGRRVRGSLERPSAAPRDAAAVLVETLAGVPTLLVLDNCEHLVAAAARLAGHLLTHCPRLRILATSREPLAIDGEALCPVPPLGLPPAGVPAGQALAFPAVRLLADRAAAVRPGFAVHDGNVAAVTEICRRLDGLPLAIELAAARLRALEPAHVAARLDDRFRLLTGGSRTALPRHQTLRAVVAWSWELLDDSERDLAERVAVFAGGVTADGVAGVCGTPPEEALELLSSLADKSLLRAVDEPAGGADRAGPRFRMLETLREFGLERLAAAGTLPAVRDAHAAYFLRLAEEAEPRLRGAGQLAWIERLIAEHDDLLAALHHATGTGDAATAVRLAAALGLFWTMRGRHAEAANWLRTALDLPGEAPWEARMTATAMVVINSAATGAPDDALRRAAELREGLRRAALADRHPLLAIVEPGLAMFADDMATGMALSERALPHPDPWTRGMLRLMRGAILENEGRLPAMRAELDEAEAEFRRAGDRWGLAMTLSVLGSLRQELGDHDGAVATLEEARQLMALLRAEPDVDQLAVRLALTRARRGERDAARGDLRIAVERSERQGNGYLAAHALLALGEVDRWDGDQAAAAAAYDRALAHAGGLAQPQLTALARTGRAVVRADDGDVAGAAADLSAALTEALNVKDMPVAAAVGVGVAHLLLARGDAARAAVALGAAAALRGVPGAGHPDVVALTARLTAALGAEAFGAAYARGRALDRAAAVACLRPAPVGPEGEGEEDQEQAH